MKMRKHAQYICTQHFPQRIQYPLHPDTMSDQVGHSQKINWEYWKYTWVGYGF